MKLLLLTPQLPWPPRQGTTIRNFNLIAHLARRHTVDLLTFLAPGEALDATNPLRTLCRRIKTVAQPVRSTRRRAADTLTTALPDMGLRLESAAMHELVRRWTGSGATPAPGGPAEDFPEQYDIVQVEGIELIQYGRAVAGRQAVAGGNGARPALVFDNHNCEYLLQQRNAFTDLRQPRRWLGAAYSLVQWQKLRRYEAAALRAGDATVAVSEADKAALEALGAGRPITVVSNGIDLVEYRPDPDAALTTTPACLVFTGKMDYRPNVDAVLWFADEVLPLIREAAPDVRLQIVGLNPHPRLERLRALAAVEITGGVPDTRPYIHHAAVYIIPMRIGGGTRFKALEAMACGQAIVSTRLGIEGIPVTDGQELLLADTPAGFAAAVLRLIGDLQGDRALRRRLGAAARSFVTAHYGWEQIVPKLEAVYDQVAG